MPYRNPCRLFHPPCIHMLRWSLKRSVKRTWSRSSFPTNESAWSIMVRAHSLVCAVALSYSLSWQANFEDVWVPRYFSSHQNPNAYWSLLTAFAKIGVAQCMQFSFWICDNYYSGFQNLVSYKLYSKVSWEPVTQLVQLSLSCSLPIYIWLLFCTFGSKDWICKTPCVKYYITELIKVEPANTDSYLHPSRRSPSHSRVFTQPKFYFILETEGQPSQCQMN